MFESWSGRHYLQTLCLIIDVSTGDSAMIEMKTFITRSTMLAVAAIIAVSLPFAATAQGAKQSRECTVEDVAVYEDRVAIRCDVKGGKKSAARIYAVATSSPIAPMVLQLSLNSMHRKVKVYFVDDVSLNPSGCEPATCRKLEGIVAIER